MCVHVRVCVCVCVCVCVPDLYAAFTVVPLFCFRRQEGKVREGKRKEGKGRERKGRGGKEREGKGREGREQRDGYVTRSSLVLLTLHRKRRSRKGRG